METLHLEALIHWRLENEKEFQRVVKEILAKGTPKAKKRALTNLAAFHLERGALGQAEEAYKQLSAIETEATPKTEIRWRLSWVKFRRKHYTHAADSFKDTAASAGPKWEHAARYWQARSLMAAGKPKDAAAPLKSLVKACPLDYYGIEAEKLLSKLGESPQSAVCPPFPSLEPTPGELERPEVATALKLMSAGLPEFALLNLEAAPKSVRSRPGVAFMTARAYFAAGKRHQAHEALVAGFGGLADNPPENAPPEFVEIAFPRLHTEHTRKTAARHGIDPHLIWAVIRQESRYDAGAVSPAGALGLMQIMPASAGINPGKGAASAKATAELLEPVNNISHGARILAKNLTQFQGRLVPAIASYNADIKKVKHWVLRHKNLPNDEFIESIPYTETRQYVKKVLSGYRAYRKIYEKRDVVGLW
jgi:soluble lytic murein transglycosylase